MKTTPLVGLIPLVIGLPNIASSTDSIGSGLFIDHLENVLGSSFDLKIAAQSLAVARMAEQVILNEIARLDAVLSRYRSDSEFSQWLAAPINESVAISDDLFTILSAFDHWHEKTGGVINAAAEYVDQLWQQAAYDQYPPTESDRRQVTTAVNQKHWLLDRNKQTVTRLTQIPLRLHTFAKSYILNQATEAALSVSGVNGLVLNGGGDIVVRGNWQEIIAIANPRADAENAVPIDRIKVKNSTVATSGDYRRGWQLGSNWVSHIMDPRTGQPAHDIISATVLHPDAVTAGALATAFNVLTPDESASLAAKLPGTEYRLVTHKGESITSIGWPGIALALPESATVTAKPTTAHLLSLPVSDKVWNASQELLISFELARIEGRSHRPFVAVWIEDETGKPVRQLALWYNKPRWLHDLRDWYSLQVGRELAASVTSATRSPGEYTLIWDGKDDNGQLVKQGKYTVMIEAAREHGTYQLIREAMDFNGKLKQQSLPGNVEIAAASLDYRQKSATR
jgi:thiamine biosynthesis lipoprotein ApbE